MIDKNLVKLALQNVFRRTMDMYQPGITISQLEPGTHLNEWNWGTGIAHYGLLKTYPLVDAATQQIYFSFWREWFDIYLDREPPTATLNGALLTNVLWQAAHDHNIPLSEAERKLYIEYCHTRVAYYRQNAIRHPSGVFGHSVAGIPESGKQVWADNLFMLVLLLAQYAVDTSDSKLFNQMCQQVELHFIHLTDPSTGLLYHGWQPDPDGAEQDLAGQRGSHLNGAVWGRGNGWAAMAIAEMLELDQHNNLNPRAYFESILKCQRADGTWGTLLDKDDSYPEMSATACFAHALLKGATLEVIGEDFALAGEKAVAALLLQISPSGEVLGVSGSTPVLPTLSDYNQVPLMPICTWGQGMALLALSQAANLTPNPFPTREGE